MTEINIEESIEKYVVVRNGCRVSENEYDTKDDKKAATELLFWKKVAPTEKVEIEKFNKKKHHIW